MEKGQSTVVNNSYQAADASVAPDADLRFWSHQSASPHKVLCIFRIFCVTIVLILSWLCAENVQNRGKGNYMTGKLSLIFLQRTALIYTFLGLDFFVKITFFKFFIIIYIFGFVPFWLQNIKRTNRFIRFCGFCGRKTDKAKTPEKLEQRCCQLLRCVNFVPFFAP